MLYNQHSAKTGPGPMATSTFITSVLRFALSECAPFRIVPVLKVSGRMVEVRSPGRPVRRVHRARPAGGGDHRSRGARPRSVLHLPVERRSRHRLFRGFREHPGEARAHREHELRQYRPLEPGARRPRDPASNHFVIEIIDLSFQPRYPPRFDSWSNHRTEVVVYHPLRLLAVSLFALLLGQLESLQAGPAAPLGSTFNYTFDSPGTLVEAGRMSDSVSPYWWLSSGAYLHVGSGVGSTIQGTLPSNDYWRRYYAQTSATDTDNGYRPQNLFRLVTRSRWQNFRQQIYFRIRRDNLSASPNRNASNGLLLMSRYLDQNNLYYAGIRVDGAAVIKKKYLGKYYTMAYARMFTGAR